MEGQAEAEGASLSGLLGMWSSPPGRDSGCWQAGSGCCCLPLPAPPACGGQDTLGEISKETVRGADLQGDTSSLGVRTQEEDGKCLALSHHISHRGVLVGIGQIPERINW